MPVLFQYAANIRFDAGARHGFSAAGTLALTALIMLASSLRADHPMNEFPLGIQFAADLADAQRLAREQNKIVMLMPAAFRSSSEDPRISPATEAFRAGPLVDDRIVKLINRRFVPYYFEMEPRGSLYDATAAEMTLLINPELKFSSVLPTPPVMFVTPEGKSLGALNLFCTPDELFSAMVSILNENENYGRLTDDELLIADPARRATVLYELGRPDDALKMLGDDQSSEGWYLRGAIARERGEWAEMKKSFKMVTDQQRVPDMVMQQIYRCWTQGNYDGIKSLFDEITPTDPRYQEAVYYAGLAHYHSGAMPEALRLWQESIQAHPQSPWSLRLDWTRGLATHGVNSPFLTNNRPESLLGRNYLSPHGNADLSRN